MLEKLNFAFYHFDVVTIVINYVSYGDKYIIIIHYHTPHGHKTRLYF